MKLELEKIKARGVSNLYRDKTTGIIYLRRSRKGHGELKTSLGTKLLEEAKELSEKRWQEFTGEKPQTKSKKLASDLFEEWVIRRQNLDKRNATITSLRQSQKFFNLYFEKMLVTDITSYWWETKFVPETRYLRCRGTRRKGELVREWMKDREEPRKIFNDWKWLTAFLNQMKSDGFYPEPPKLAKVDAEDLIGKLYSDQEVKRLIDRSWGNMTLFVLMAVTMGMRRSEITKLRKERINLNKRTIALAAADTKTKKPRTFVVSPDVWPLLLKQLDAHPDSLFVFPGRRPGQPTQGFTKAWKSLKRIAGVDGRFHDLRHTFLTKAFKAKGSNPVLICEYAGLSLKVAMKVYLHTDEEDTRQIASLVQFESLHRHSETNSETENQK